MLVRVIKSSDDLVKKDLNLLSRLSKNALKNVEFPRVSVELPKSLDSDILTKSVNMPKIAKGNSEIYIPDCDIIYIGTPCPGPY